jgi:acyl carrier protein
MIDRGVEVRAFVIENFFYGAKDAQLGEEDSLIRLGIIDSTGVLELVNFLEDKFGIVIKDDELIPANLDSIVKIVNFLDCKLLMGLSETSP